MPLVSLGPRYPFFEQHVNASGGLKQHRCGADNRVSRHSPPQIARTQLPSDILNARGCDYFAVSLLFLLTVSGIQVSVGAILIIIRSVVRYSFSTTI